MRSRALHRHSCSISSNAMPLRARRDETAPCARRSEPRHAAAIRATRRSARASRRARGVSRGRRRCDVDRHRPLRGGDVGSARRRSQSVEFCPRAGAAAIAAGAALYGGTRASSAASGRRAPGALDAGRGPWSRARGACDQRLHGQLVARPAAHDRALIRCHRGLAALPEAAARAIMPGRSVLYESGTITVYYRIDSGQRLLIGGRGPMREIHSVGADPASGAVCRQALAGSRGAEWTHAWGGRLAMTRDHYPHVHEPAPGVLVCLGYNGRGVAMATAMGAQLRAADHATRSPVRPAGDGHENHRRSMPRSGRPVVKARHPLQTPGAISSAFERGSIVRVELPQPAHIDDHVESLIRRKLRPGREHRNVN